MHRDPGRSIHRQAAAGMEPRLIGTPDPEGLRPGNTFIPDWRGDSRHFYAQCTFRANATFKRNARSGVWNKRRTWWWLTEVGVGLKVWVGYGLLGTLDIEGLRPDLFHQQVLPSIHFTCRYMLKLRLVWGIERFLSLNSLLRVYHLRFCTRIF